MRSRTQRAAKGPRSLTRRSSLGSLLRRTQVLQPLRHAVEHGQRAREDPLALRRQVVVAARPAAAHGDGLGELRLDEALLGEARESGVDRADGDGPPAALLDLAPHRDPVGLVTQPGQRQQDDQLELGREDPLGRAAHLFYNGIYIAERRQRKTRLHPASTEWPVRGFCARSGPRRARDRVALPRSPSGPTMSADDPKTRRESPPDAGAAPGEDFIRDHSAGAAPGEDFIRDIVRADLRSGRRRTVVTRFPPEPNGYPHIGHAKSICLNFGLAAEFGGACNLRFDDSNPLTEDMEYVEAIQRDVRWLGFDWGERLYFASDYFERLYELAELLVRKGLAYVDSLSEEEIRAYRGTVTDPGRPSPHRDRGVEENLDLLRRMRAGELPDGAAVLRARIDMAAPNMKMRDPLLYRIRHAEHYRRGGTWCIYPMYDFIHPLSDAFEGITHSLCTLEFENNRALYAWLLAAVDWPEPRPRQYEFARLNLNYTVMSKRKLLELVESGIRSEEHASELTYTCILVCLLR